MAFAISSLTGNYFDFKPMLIVILNRKTRSAAIRCNSFVCLICVLFFCISISAQNSEKGLFGKSFASAHYKFKSVICLFPSDSGYHHPALIQEQLDKLDLTTTCSKPFTQHLPGWAPVSGKFYKENRPLLAKSGWQPTSKVNTSITAGLHPIMSALR